MAVLSSATVVQAGEEPKKAAPEKPHPDGAVWIDVGFPGSQYWLGVMAVPVDAVLKSHLHLTGGLVVQNVVPDSPAHKAGVRENDILLTFGGQPVTSVAELSERVTAAKDQATKLTLLREGKEQTVEVKPAKHPAQAMFRTVPLNELDSARKWLEKLQRGEMDDLPARMFMFRPGIVLPDNVPDHVKQLFPGPGGHHRRLSALLPQNMAITVTKPQEGPVRIVVKKDGQSWEVTEDELDKLPEDVRSVVKGMLGRGGAFSVFGRDGGIRIEMEGRDGHGKPGEKKPDAAKKAPDVKSDKDALLKKLDDANRRLEEQRLRLQEEFRKLRQEVEENKKS
jgi:hypothetical protein